MMAPKEKTLPPQLLIRPKQLLYRESVISGDLARSLRYSALKDALSSVFKSRRAKSLYSSSLARGCLSTQLERDADRKANARVPAVIQVISVVHIAYIDIVIVIPVIAPIGWPWINDAEPIATVLKARKSADHKEGESADAESMPLAEGDAEAVVGDPKAVVAAALLPGAVVSLPVSCAVLLPCALLDTMLILGALLWLIVLTTTRLLLRLALCLPRRLLLGPAVLGRARLLLGALLCSAALD